MPNHRLPKVIVALTAVVFFTTGSVYGESPSPENGKVVQNTLDVFSEGKPDLSQRKESVLAFATIHEETKKEVDKAFPSDVDDPTTSPMPREHLALEKLAPELAASVSPEEGALFASGDIPRVHVVATAYTAGPESTGKTPGHPAYGVTASGVKVRRDRFSTIAADPREFPYGTVLFVPGYGFGVVADTGGLVRGKHIDLYVPTLQEAVREWGKRTVEVFVLAWGTGEVDESFLDSLNTYGLHTLLKSWKEKTTVESNRVLE